MGRGVLCLQWQRLCGLGACSDILIAHYPQMCSFPRCGKRVSALSVKDSTFRLFSVIVSVASNGSSLLFLWDSLCVDGTPIRIAVRIILSGLPWMLNREAPNSRPGSTFSVGCAGCKTHEHYVVPSLEGPSFFIFYISPLVVSCIISRVYNWGEAGIDQSIPSWL